MENFIEKTREAFDIAADKYDEHDNQNPILQWMRSVVHKIYLREIPKGSRVLELNCGTGVDAVFLAENGISVYAADISAKMIDVLIKNADAQISNGMVKYAVKSFDNISEIEDTGFDAVISNFGGLNCINDFSRLSTDIFNKLKPGGKFIAVVMNKFCPWEIFYYSIRLDFKKAFRRFGKEGIDACLNGGKVRTFYFSPNQFAGFFQSHFSTKKIYTLGYYTPSPYLIGIYHRIKFIVKLFMKIDEKIKGIFPFNRFGDHFIIVMRKK